MHYYEVAPAQIIRGDATVFTYEHAEVMLAGQIVIVEVGRRKVVGLVMHEVAKPSYQTKPISHVIESDPIPHALVELAKWLSEYYATHLGVTLQTVLPKGIQKKRQKRAAPTNIPVRKRTKIVFNVHQTEALKQIELASTGTMLLHGITGSGKTAVYIEAARKSLERGQSVIVLVPEISLTPQIVDEFIFHFDTVILTHSRQTEAERHIAWQEALHSKKPQVVIGPRSALFMPLKSIGLIVIDEAHEPTYKQEQSPRYSALRAASILAKHHGARLVLGSATPLISDYYIASEQKRPIITMTSTAQQSVRPHIHLVDMTKRDNFNRHRFLSDSLITKLEETFSKGKQALIFHNRRGSTSITLCENCGWQAVCPRCFIPTTLHADAHKLRCHVCGFQDKVPTSCPNCHHANIIHKGIGTKLIESELAKIFPKIIIARFDGDSDANQALDNRYKDLYDGSINLIIGTQIVAKGLDLPLLRTVGVVQADSGLSLPDYGASERAFQLLAQAVGRVGRSSHKTSVIVQSYQPSHPAIVDGLSQNYLDFYDKAIIERKKSHFPPFVFLLKLTCVYKTEAAAVKNTRAMAAKLKQRMPQHVEILGPAPAFYERQRDTYRWQLILKSTERSLLIDALRLLPSTHWQFELDPSSLL